MTAPEARRVAPDGRVRRWEIRCLLVDLRATQAALIARLEEMRRQARDAAEMLRRMQ